MRPLQHNTSEQGELGSGPSTCQDGKGVGSAQLWMQGGGEGLTITLRKCSSDGTGERCWGKHCDSSAQHKADAHEHILCTCPPPGLFQHTP